MANALRDYLLFNQVKNLALDWLDAGVTLGTFRADTINFSGQHQLILGLGGSDRINVTGRYDGLGNAVFGGAGDDSISITGNRNVVSGDAGDDFINFLTPSSNPENNSNTVLGGAGNDFIFVNGRHNFVSGGSGNDSMSGAGISDRSEPTSNIINGDAGNDNVQAYGIGDQLNGGSGNDNLLSVLATIARPGDEPFRGDSVGTSQTLTGGSGEDSFIFINFTTLIVEGDQDGRLSEDDVITGLFPVVTDYEEGEVIDIREASLNEQTDDIILSQTAPGQGNIRLDAATHAIVHGNLTEPGNFVVEDDGEDTLVVYNWTDRSDIPAEGVFVLNGYSGDIVFA